MGSENHTSWSPSFAICLIIRANMKTRRNCKVSIWKAFEKGLGVLRKGVSFQKFEAALFMILWVIEEKNSQLTVNAAVVTLFWPRFSSKSDCYSVFHAEKSRTLNWNILRPIKGIFKLLTVFVPFFVGSFMSDQLAFWVDFSFKKWPNASDF